MADRDALIAAKLEVRRRIERLQQQLEQLRTPEAVRNARRIARLESELERLQADESMLRMAIDRSAVH